MYKVYIMFCGKNPQNSAAVNADPNDLLQKIFLSFQKIALHDKVGIFRQNLGSVELFSKHRHFQPTVETTSYWGDNINKFK